MRVPAGWCIVLRDERGSGRGVFDTTEELEAALRAHRLEGEGGVAAGNTTCKWGKGVCDKPARECNAVHSCTAPATEYERDIAEAVKLFGQTQRPSASALQRHLRIGYMRAARVLDILEERGLVGPPRGMEGRECYINANAPSPGKGEK